MQNEKTIGVVGLGWLGESLAYHLKNEGYQLWGTTRSLEKKSKIQETGVEVHIWDKPNTFSDKLRLALSKSDVLVLNLPPSVFTHNTYAEGLQAVTQYVSPTCQVIFTSSSGIYPAHLEDATEDYVFLPEESNRLVEAEQVLKQALKENLCILRLSGLIGEDRNPVFYLAKKEVNGEPNKKVNLIHRKDILRIISKIISENHFDTLLNVCHPDHPTRKDYYTKAAKQYNLGEIHFEKNDTELFSRKVNSCKLQNNLNYLTFEPLID